MYDDVRTAVSHWFQMIDGLKFSSTEFYKSVRVTIHARGVEEIDTRLVNHFEGGLISAKREYLQIGMRGYLFDVCAAPFGDSFFISYWYSTPPGLIQGLLMKIPFIGEFLIRLLFPRTMYYMDTLTMFQQLVHSAITKTIDEISKKNGIRLLTEEEKKPIIKNIFK